MRTAQVALAVILLVTLIALTPTAYASPPDPTWIPGLYDNADFDDVVLFIAGSLGVVERSARAFVRPPAVAVGLVVPDHTFSLTTSSLSSRPSRAPPLA